MASIPLANLVVAAVSIVGRKRDHNEDAFGFGRVGQPPVTRSAHEERLGAEAPGVLLMVCDGIGGSAAGEVASALAVQTLPGKLDSVPFTPDGLLAAIKETDAVLQAKAKNKPELKGMGATLSCLWLHGGRALWGQAGDSRGYRWREDVLLQFTPEHTPVGRMVRSGDLTEADARRHLYRHMMDQCLGGTMGPFEPEAGAIDVAAGDLFLLCSDGLTDGLDTAALAEALRRGNGQPPAETARELVAAANSASGRDNITALVARVDTGGDADCGGLLRWFRR